MITNSGLRLPLTGPSNLGALLRHRGPRATGTPAAAAGERIIRDHPLSEGGRGATIAATDGAATTTAVGMVGQGAVTTTAAAVGMVGEAAVTTTAPAVGLE